MKNNICLFFLLLITINTSCQKKGGINMQTKESSENYMLTELEKTYGVKFEIDNKRGGSSFWTQKVFGKETKCFDAAVKVLNGDEQKYIVSMDETGFFEDTIHLQRFHKEIISEIATLLKNDFFPFNYEIELVGLLREKKFMEAANLEKYYESRAFETWVTITLPSGKNIDNYVNDISNVLQILFQKKYSKFNITITFLANEKEIFFRDLDQYEHFNMIFFTKEKIMSVVNDNFE